VRIRVPRKRIREEFNLTYELFGCQRAVDYLSKHYKVKRMKIILNGKKLGRNCEAFYFNGKAYFSKKSLKKRNVLHEFYHFLVESKGLDIPESVEEHDANRFAREFLA
jgi:predicted RNA-binding protein associated with RNAse of E/G family